MCLHLHIIINTFTIINNKKSMTLNELKLPYHSKKIYNNADSALNKKCKK